MTTSTTVSTGGSDKRRAHVLLQNTATLLGINLRKVGDRGYTLLEGGLMHCITPAPGIVIPIPMDVVEGRMHSRALAITLNIRVAGNMHFVVIADYLYGTNIFLLDFGRNGGPKDPILGYEYSRKRIMQKIEPYVAGCWVVSYNGVMHPAPVGSVSNFLDKYDSKIPMEKQLKKVGLVCL